MDGQAVEPITEAPRARRFPLPSRGGEIAALEFGPADRPLDILFCHANGFNALTYRSILAPLEGLRVLAIDLRGHGATTLPTPIEDRDGWKIYRDDILALLPFVAEAPVVMAGHSMGGASSLLVAAAAPEKVRSLVLFDPVLMPDALSAAAAPSAVAQSPMVQGALRRRATFADKAAAFAAYRGRGAFATWSEAQLADYVEAGFVATDDGQVTLACAPAWEASNFASYDPDIYPALVAEPCPIRILRAETGSTCRIEDRLPDLTASGRVRVETVAGTSHFLPMERPDLVRQALWAAARV